MAEKLLEPIILVDGETLLLQVECEHLHGATYHHGILTLTNERLHFTRQDQPEPLVWETQLGSIQGARVDVARRTVSFELYLSDFTFRGDGAMHLHVAFAQEYWRRTQSVELYGAGETVLLTGPVSLYRHDALASQGEIALSGEALTFTSREGEPELVLTCPLRELNELTLQGVNRRLSLIMQGSRYQLQGELVPRLYGILAALSDGSDFDANPANFTTWKTALYRGPLLQYGELVCSPTTSRFASTGKLDAFLGLDREIELQTSDIVSVEVKGVLEKKLFIQTEEEGFSFKLPDVQSRFTALREVMTETGGEFLTPESVEEDARTRIAPFLPEWESLIGSQDIDDVLFFTPAWQLFEGDLGFLGHLVMTRGSVFFIPQGKKSREEDVVKLRSDRLLPPSGKTANSGIISLSDGGDEVLFGFGRGNTSVASFWTAWRREMDRTGKGLLHPLLRPEADNRREAFRASLMQRPDAYIFIETPGETTREMHKAVFADLSVGGCSLVTTNAVDENQRIKVELPAVGRGRVVQAEIVHTDDVGEETNQWRHGVRFLGLTEEEILRVRESVMALQRSSLSNRADLREDTKQYEE